MPYISTDETGSIVVDTSCADDGSAELEEFLATNSFDREPTEEEMALLPEDIEDEDPDIRMLEPSARPVGKCSWPPINEVPHEDQEEQSMSDHSAWTFGSSTAFYTFAREERQLCAMLAHLLMQRGSNPQTFLALFEAQLARENLEPYARDQVVQVESAQVYIEFAFLRDRWNQFSADPVPDLATRNKAKREFLLEMLTRVDTLKKLELQNPFPAEVDRFNACFMGSAGPQVKHDIASPALWNVGALYRLAGLDRGVTEERKGVFRDLCKFKWSFRIKPDLVIVFPGLEPICVEGKLESGEGRYPTKPSETKLFDYVFMGADQRVRQVELQDFMFRVLLGCGSRLLFIAQKEGRVTIPGPGGTTVNVPQLRWDRVFKALDQADSIPFVRSFISENRLINPTESLTHMASASNRNSPAAGARSRPTSRVRIPNYDGKLPMDRLLALCRNRGDGIQVGFTGGESALNSADAAFLHRRKWLWRDPATNQGKITRRNWITGSRFLARAS